MINNIESDGWGYAYGKDDGDLGTGFCHAKIDDMRYAASLEAKGFAAERIRKYGFAFEGKKVLIGSL